MCKRQPIRKPRIIFLVLMNYRQAINACVTFYRIVRVIEEDIVASDYRVPAAKLKG